MPDPLPFTMTRTERWVVRSTRTGTPHRIDVARPMPPFMGEERGPAAVLWVLDGNLFFATAVEATRLMFQLFGELPPLLVVGVGWDEDDPRTLGALRTRDLTPTVDAGSGTAVGAAAPESSMGRAGALLSFLVEEAGPLVDERMGAAGLPRALFGASLGGLFVLHALQEANDAFEGWVAASPALWWDDERVLRDLEARTRGGPPLRGRVFLGVGALEEPEGAAWSRFRLVGNVRRAADVLRAAPTAGLEVGHHVFEGETHTSVWPAVLTRGLRRVVAPRPVGGSAGEE